MNALYEERKVKDCLVTLARKARRKVSSCRVKINVSKKMWAGVVGLVLAVVIIGSWTREGTAEVNVAQVERIGRFFAPSDDLMIRRTTSFSLSVFVASSRENAEARQAIRETWGSLPFYQVKIFFVVGSRYCGIPPDYQSFKERCSLMDGMNVELEERKRYFLEQEDLSKKLRAEAKEHSDIILINEIDAYGTQPAKTKAIIEWCHTHTPLSWCMKVDDGVFVNLDRILPTLMALDPAENVLVGQIWWNNFVWKEGRAGDFLYTKNEFYPPYADGSSGYILSPAFVSTIMSKFNDLPLYRNEDSTIGIWIETFGWKVEFVEGIYSYRVYNRHESCNLSDTFEEWSMFHRLDPENMRKCFQMKQDLNRISIRILRGHHVASTV